jgi:predicted extracellular nuclease
MTSIAFDLAAGINQNLNNSVIAAEDFDGNAVNLVAGFEPGTDNLDGGPGDFFGVGSINNWPQASGIPFSLADDSVVSIGGGAFAGDTEGVYGQNSDFDNDFFGISDSDEFGADQTASWTFNISGATELELLIDMGGISNSDFGGFSTGTDAKFTIQIDGGAEQIAFDLNPVDANGFTTRPMDSGNASGGGRVLEVTGDNTVTKLLAEDGSEATNTFLDKTPASGAGAGELDTFLTTIDGTGSTLTLAFTTDFPFEAMAFDNIEIRGVGGSGGDNGDTPVVFISEFHYDNEGTDVGEFIEVTATAGTDLAGYSLVLYNGNGGASYDTEFLSGIVTDQFNGLGTAVVDFPSNGIQNGSPDGIALVAPDGTVVEFISYEGSFTAVGGAADGLLSTDIGVEESSSTAVGQSLQLINRIWTAPAAETKGVVNGADNSDGDNGGGDVTITPIYDIQGAGHVSGFVGQAVTTTGIVTAVDGNGFYLQEAAGDDNITTSDAIFVFTGSSPSVAVGNELQVSGVVSEFTPGGTSTRNLSTTQLGSVTTIEVLSTENELPTAVILGNSGRQVPTEIIEDDNFTSFDPETDGADFFESLEGMLVTVENAVAVSGTNQFGEIFTVANQDVTGLSDRGTLNISPNDFNPEKIQIDTDFDVSGFENPLVDVGAQLGNVTGVISYDFGNFQVVPTQDFTAQVIASTLEADSTELVGTDDRLTIASYNVLNLDPIVEIQANTNNGEARNVDDDLGDGRFDAIAEQIVSNLNAPDIIGLQEIQDNTGGEIVDDVIAADITLQRLIDAIVVAGGPTYEFIDNTFITDEASGGQPGGNIRTAYLYNPERVDLVEGSVQTISGQGAGEAFEGARLPLVANFTFNGEMVTVVNNHFSSKGGSAPIIGLEQPFEARQEDLTVNGSLDERQRQSAAIQAFVSGVLVENANANIVVLGDLNEFEFVSPVIGLEEAGLTNLTNTLPENERYTFNFQGNSQSLDHILTLVVQKTPETLVNRGFSKRRQFLSFSRK